MVVIRLDSGTSHGALLPWIRSVGSLIQPSQQIPRCFRDHRTWIISRVCFAQSLVDSYLYTVHYTYADRHTLTEVIRSIYYNATLSYGINQPNLMQRVTRELCSQGITLLAWKLPLLLHLSSASGFFESSPERGVTSETPPVSSPLSLCTSLTKLIILADSFLLNPLSEFYRPK